MKTTMNSKTVRRKNRVACRLLSFSALLALLISLVTAQTASATQLDAHFYGGLPAGWETGGTGSYAVWTDPNPGISTVYLSTTGGGCAWLASQWIYIPEGGALLEFSHAFSTEGGDAPTFFVQLYGGFGEWEQATTWSEANNPGRTEYVSLAIEHYGDARWVKIRWYVGGDEDAGTTVWGISHARVYAYIPKNSHVQIQNDYRPSPATVGVPYSLDLVAAGGVGPYTFTRENPWSSLAGSGPLPPGLQITTDADHNNRLVGTPASAGRYDFYFKATDTNSESGYKATQLVVKDDTTITVSGPATPPHSSDVLFSAVIRRSSDNELLPSSYYRWALDDPDGDPCQMESSTIRYDHAYVRFTDNGVVIHGCEAVGASGGYAICYTGLTAGEHQIVAQFLGNEVYSASTSPALPYTPNCETTTTVTSAETYIDPGKVTLEDAIKATERCVGSTINFDGDYTIHRLLAPITVVKSAIIDGAGHTVTLTGDYGVLNLKDNWKSLTLKNLTVAGATCPLNNEGGTMAVSNVTFSGNRCAYGGSIRSNGGTLTVTDSTFRDNHAGTTAAGGGGGAIYSVNSAAVTVSGSAFLDNGAEWGGAINASDSSLAVANSTFSGNAANASGGGIWSSVYSLAVANCTFVGNSAGSAEGSFGPAIAYDTPTVNLNNTLLYGNLPSGACTGAQHNNSGSNNLADDATCDDGGFTQSGSIQLGWLGYYGGSTLSFPLLEGSDGIDSGSSSACPAVDQRGVTRPQGSGCDAGAFERQSGETSAPQILLQPLSQIVLEGDPVTLDVAGSGIPTPSVHWEMSTDSGATWTDISGATALSYSFTASQAENGYQYRAVLESSAGSATSDAAAFTNYHAPACTVTSSADSGDGTLRAWLADPTCSTITFYKDVTIALAGPLTISRDVTVDGESHHITIHGDTDGDGVGEVALVEVSAEATAAGLKNLTLDKGFSASSGAIHNLGGLTLENTTLSNSGQAGNTGSAVLNEGTLTVRGCTFAANISFMGGAIASIGPLTVSGSTFAWNLGVFGGGAISVLGETTVTNSTFVSNGAGLNGAAIGIGTGAGLASPAITLENNTFSGNMATGGGAIETMDIPGNTPTINAYNNLLVDRATSTSSDMNCLFRGATVNAANNLTDDDPADPSCPAAGFTPSTGINLGALGDNGGPVETIPLLEGSAAIDAGDNSYCPSADARGIVRPQGVYCDVGAFEVEAQGPAVTLQPLGQSVYAGDAASFSAAASGIPTPSIHWEMSADSGATWTDIDGATGSTLSLNPTYAQNGAQYRAVFDNTEGEAASDAATLTVWKKAAAVTLSDLWHAYDGQAKSATATTDPAGLTVEVTYDGSSTEPVGAGEYTVVATVDSDTYEGAATGTLVIGKAGATVTLANPNASYAYDGAAKAAAATTNPAGLEVLFFYDGSSSAPSAAGNYVVVATIEDSNYSGGALGSLTITKIPASVTPAAAGKVYGEADPGLTGALSGFVESDGVTAAYSRTAGEDVGSYTISAELSPGGVLDNYDITYNTAAFTVDQRQVTVTADPQSKVAGAGDPELTYQVTSGSLAAGDAFSGALARDQGEDPGSYAIRQGTLALSSNYELTYQGANLTIVGANTAPTANPGGPYLGAINTAIPFDGSGSTDPDGDPLTYAWTFGDGNTGSGAAPSHAYAAAGIYDVCLIVNDGTADSDPACTLAVAYDPSAGFVTGGGWFDSPAGAYFPDPNLSGRANFGFVSKYTKGQQVPTGTTQFQLAVAGFSFYSETYEWLVVNQGGMNAQFKGSGTVNGGLDPNGNPYKFMIRATDGSPDTLRIRIWWEAGGVETDVYDNGAEQAIGGGNIVIHKSK
jgi:hypothetical protein